MNIKSKDGYGKKLKKGAMVSTRGKREGGLWEIKSFIIECHFENICSLKGENHLSFTLYPIIECLYEV